MKQDKTKAILQSTELHKNWEYVIIQLVKLCVKNVRKRKWKEHPGPQIYDQTADR